ncbi:MAG: Ig-like domain-containing protein [Planctomycetota bacterium]
MNRTLAILAFAAVTAAGETVVLEEDALRGLVAARPPSAISILQGTKPGDPARAPANVELQEALCNPDAVWSVVRHSPAESLTFIMVKGAQSWTTSSSADKFTVTGPLRGDAADLAVAAAGFGGSEKAIDATGELLNEELQLLRLVSRWKDGDATAENLAARALALCGMPADTVGLALRSLQDAGWIVAENAQGARVLRAARPELAQALTASADVVEISRLDAGGRAGPVTFASSAAGTVARAASKFEGLATPRAAAAAALLRKLAPRAPDAAGARGGDAIRAEIEKGIFRLGQATSTREAFGHGQPDTWRVDKVAEYQDTTGSGAIDWVKVDDFGTGKWTRSYVLLDGKWQESNILDVFLEIEFKLPWDRSAYHPHNVDIRLNGKTIATLEDTLPEGWYRFQLRPQDVQIPKGAGATNEVRLVTTHLRGGHYVVSTSFNLAFQLGTVSRYVIAADEEEAHKILMESGKFTSGGVDAALYSNEWTASSMRPKDGEPVTLRGLVRNLGGNPIPGGRLVVLEGGMEVASRDLPAVGGADLAACEIAVKLTPGIHRLTVTATTDGDPRPLNNAVPFEIRCGGDDVKPDLAVTAPAEGGKAAPGEISVSGTAADNVGLKAIEISVNGGLWISVTPAAAWEAKVTIGKGPQRIRVRCVDTSGNANEVVRVIEGR